MHEDSRYYPIDIAANIGRVSRRTAATWARAGVLVPSRVYATAHRPYTHLYSFDDLVAFRAIAVLREGYGVPLRSARVAADYIRTGRKSHWRDAQFWLDDKQVFLSDPGTTSALRFDLESIANDVRQEANRLWQRAPDDYGQVEYRRDVMGGTLVVKGTRVSVATVANLVAAGWDIEQIQHAYPVLQPEDIHGVMEHVEEQRNVA